MRPIDRIKRTRPRIRRTDLVDSRVRRMLEDACSEYVRGITGESTKMICDYFRDQLHRASFVHGSTSVEIKDVDTANGIMTVGVTVYPPPSPLHVRLKL